MKDNEKTKSQRMDELQRLRNRVADLELAESLRRSAEEALRLSEERYRTVVEDMPALVCRFDRKGRLTFVNQTYCDYFQKNRESLIGCNFFNLLPPGERAKVKRHYKSLTIDRPCVTYEHQVMAPDGSIRYQRWTDRVLFDEGGEAVEYQSIGIDITKSKLAEEKIKQQKVFLETVIESITHPFYVIDVKDRRVRMANSAARAGKAKLPSTCHELVRHRKTPCDDEHRRCPLSEIKRTGHAVVLERYERDGAGKERAFEVHGYPIFNGDAELVQVIMYLLDITDRKNAEMKLEKITNSLTDRVKELDCLCKISHLMTDREPPSDQILQSIADVLPEAWGRAGRTSARIAIGEKTFHSGRPAGNGTAMTEWISVNGSPAGRVEISFESGDSDEGPAYSSEDRQLLKVIVERLSEYLGYKQIEESLEMERFLMRTLMDNIPDNIYFKDLEDRFIRVNKAMARYFKLADPKEAEGKTDFDFFSEEHAALACRDERRIIDTGQPLIGLDEKETWDDGRVTWVSTTKMPLLEGSGKTIGTFGISRDITERQKALQMAQVESAKLRSMIEGMDGGVIMADETGTLVEVNRWFLKMTGKDRKDIIGKKIQDFHSLEVVDRINGIINGFRAGKTKTIIINRELLGQQVSLRIQPVYRPGEIYGGIIFNLIDISDVVKAKVEAEERLKTIKQLKELMPICMYCKKIRDDDNYWRQVEDYIHRYTGSDFSHGICPECFEKHYSEKQSPLKK